MNILYPITIHDDGGNAAIGRQLIHERSTYIRHFWASMLLTRTTKREHEVQKTIELLGIPIDFHTDYRLVLVSTRADSIDQSAWKSRHISARVSDILSFLTDSRQKELENFSTAVDDTSVFFVCQESEKSLAYILWEWTTVCRQSLGIQMTCFVGPSRKLLALSQDSYSLQRMASFDPHTEPVVFLEEKEKDRQKTAKHSYFNIRKWSILFSKREEDQLRTLFFQDLAETAEEMLFILQQKITQSFFTSLRLRDIPEESIYTEPEYLQTFVHSYRSKESMNIWFENLLSYNRSLPFLSDTGNQLIAGQIKSYIDENLHRELTRQEIADHLFLSVSYIAAVFKKETGVSITNYMIRAKMELARKLLVSTDKTVNMIASACGYDDFAYFSKLFKKTFGFSPVQYRKKYKEEMIF